MKSRIQLINAIIKAANFKNYLEIGTRDGTSLYNISCKNKIAIDPNFIISKKEKLKRKIFDLKNARKTYYFEQTSDAFFQKEANTILQKIGNIDISLVDGMHTFEQALKDVLNQLKFINDRSVIVLHDCFPVSEPASYSYNSQDFHRRFEHPKWSGEWNGDTWKTITYLLKKYPNDLDVFVFNTDYGLGIVQRKNNKPLDKNIDYSIYDEISKLTYDDLMRDPTKYIKLTPQSDIFTFIEKFKY